MKKWSIYQEAIFEKYKSTDSNITVKAVPGSGKTTTIEQMAKYYSKGSTGLFSFNTSIAKELGRRLGFAATCSTLHSMGAQSIFHRYKGIEVKPNKVANAIAKKIGSWKVDHKKKGFVFEVVGRLVDLYRLTLCTSLDDLKLVALTIGVPAEENHYKWALEIISGLERYNRSPDEIDFTDMIYLPATDKKFELDTFKNVFVDEFQDLNNCQHLLIDRLLEKGGRGIFVGDENQAIYGFAGANQESFKKASIKPNTLNLPLSICYRCPQRVIDHANEVFNVIIPNEGISQGEVALGKIEMIRTGDYVLCRNLKPLLPLYFRLIGEGKKVTIRGKDIAEKLLTLVKPYCGDDLKTMLKGLEEDLLRVYLNLQQQGIENPFRHPSYINFQERTEALVIISGFFFTPQQIFEALKNMFSDNTDEGILLSTIHKAKGLEADRIFLLNRHLIPSKWAKSEQELLQERNLLYVAITRAKQALYYIYL